MSRRRSRLALSLVLVVCFFVGAAVRTRTGRVVRERVEKAFFERLPGYGLLRSLTQRLANDGDETAWKPALVEIEEALVPPFAGAVYILNRERVHALDVPFTQAIRSVSRWGSGTKDLVAAMRSG